MSRASSMKIRWQSKSSGPLHSMVAPVAHRLTPVASQRAQISRRIVASTSASTNGLLESATINFKCPTIRRVPRRIASIARCGFHLEISCSRQCQGPSRGRAERWLCVVTPVGYCNRYTSALPQRSPNSRFSVARPSQRHYCYVQFKWRAILRRRPFRP